MTIIYKFIPIITAIILFAGFRALSLQEEEPAGKRIFIDNKCTSCHTVAAAGITSKTKKKNIVDLSDVGNELKSDFIIKFVTKQEKLEGVGHPIAFKGSEEELNTLVKWLESLKVTKEEHNEEKQESDKK